MLFRTTIATLALFIGICPALARAQAEPELGIDKATSGVVRTETAKKRARTYIAERGWKKGMNTKSDGSEFFVAIGVGTNTATPSDPGWVGARALSFDEALLQAKSDIAKYINTQISTSLEREYSRTMGQAPEAKKAEKPAGPDDVMGKMNLLLRAKLDQALAKEGVEPNSPEAPAAVQKFLREKSMKKAIEAVAKARVSGVQVAKIFESKGEGKKGQIAVVAIQSDKLKRMADAIASQNYSSLPSGKPKKAIRDQIPTDPAVLVAMFGVQQTRDENGRYVIVSYGQSFPFIQGDEDEMEMAYDDAQMAAEAYIRDFAGESVTVFQSAKQSANLQTLVQDQERRQFNKTDRKKNTAAAEQLKISGFVPIFEEEMVHPFTGKELVVSVVTWSPEAGRSGRALGEKMKKPATNASGTDNSDQWGKADYGSGYRAEGTDVDEEDF